MRLWPKSIVGQMLCGLLLLEAVSFCGFMVLLTARQSREVHDRAWQRLAHQVSSVALQVRESLAEGRPEMAQVSIKMMGEAPSVSLTKFSDPGGNVVYASTSTAGGRLSAAELRQIPRIQGDEPLVFDLTADHWESVRPVYVGGVLRGYAWVETEHRWDDEEMRTVWLSTGVFAGIWMLASAVLVLVVSRLITRPLAVLHRGTRALMDAPEKGGDFPLPVKAQNEFGELIEAFNRMVASIEEQRAGLNDTLSMLDSMLANAPIGLAFFDRRCRLVRVNHVFADMTGVAQSRHLGRTLAELLPLPMVEELERAVASVFESGAPVRNLEMTGQNGPLSKPWTWLVSTYPVRTAPSQVRWAGMIVLDTNERKRNEEALRRTEKLAAAGRLAASIAHEINNPLEAITNLLFLLKHYCTLEASAMGYVEMAEHEARRIAEITQQTLRFYRQSTSPARTNLSELLDSVLGLYQVRLRNLGIDVKRDYDPATSLFCFAGEVRQVLANLVGNSIDAMPAGGRMVIRARRSKHWAHPGLSGVRFTVADTGAGFDREVQDHIFEAFFTTKEVTGTGLGLWVSHEIILKHHGLVHVRSRTAASGRAPGTVFQIFFPDDEGLRNERRSAAPAATKATGTEGFPRAG